MRIQLDLGVPVLAAAAGLANVFAFRLGVLANGLAISHLRLADVGLNLVLAHHAVDDDFQMQLAHAADDGLSAVGIGVNFKRGIFLRQAPQRHAHFFLIGFRLGLNRNRNHGHRKRNIFERDGMLLIADRVARADALQSNGGANVARENFADLFALVGVHLQQPPNALTSAPARVQHGVSGLQSARSKRE